MIDVHKEQLVKVADGAKKLPGVACYNTLRDWIKEGVTPKGGGERIRLEYVQIGRTWYTSIEAYDRFIERIN